MLSLLQSNDPTYRSVVSMRELFANLPITDVMNNGNIEMVLKSFLSAGWKSGAPHVRACLMDKHFNGQRIDLASFENGNLAFWLEAKCSFMQDNNLVSNAAAAAVNQIIEYELQVQDNDYDGHQQFFQASTYIVHFLTSIPNNDMNVPNWARPNYPNDPPYHPGMLEQHYQTLLQDRYLSSIYLPVFLDPAVFAVIIKLAPLNPIQPEVAA